MQIRSVRAGDAAAVAAVYNHYVEHTTVTFEERALSAAAIARRIAGIAETYPYFVADNGTRVVGFTYASRWHERSAYGLSVETAIYVAPDTVGAGIGTALYARLLDELDAAGYHCALAGIALPNEASVALHEKLGFARVGCFREVGRKLDRWVDVGYWQRLFDGAAGAS